VQTTTVLDMLVGVQKVLAQPLAEPAVFVDVFSEVGWLKNDTSALRSLAPDARIHLDSSPSATVNVLVQMAQADLLIMGSSGFSFWAGIFSCGVKVGYIREEADPLPMRFVKYASTITTRRGPFWPSAGDALTQEWTRYWSCRSDPSCRPTLCGSQHLHPDGSAWTRSKLAQEQLSDSAAVQWRLAELVLWPKNATATPEEMMPLGSEAPALADMRHSCAMQKLAKKSTASKASMAVSSFAPFRSHGMDGCMRNAWLHNLTSFLSARRKVPHGVISVG
jgi:hypothetical protein